MAHVLQERYASLVDAKLRATLVTLDTGSAAIFNTNYEGDPKAGAVKIPVRDTEVSVRDYNRLTGIAGAAGATAYITVTDFHEKAVNEIIDGYDAAAVPDNLVADRLDSAGYAGGLTLDTDGIATLEAEGTTAASTTALTAETVYSGFVAARTALTKANVPATGRYAIVSADTMALLLESDKFIKQSDIGQELVMQGYVGKIAGFAIKESNDLDAATEFIAGHSQNSTRIREWTVQPRIQSLDGDGVHIGASAVQGRWVYKHKVTKGVTVYVKTKA